MGKNRKNSTKKSTDMLFPPTLGHTKIRINKIPPKQSDKHAHLDENITTYLSDYLITKNPMSFVYAINNKPELIHDYLAGRETSLDVELCQKVKEALEKCRNIKTGNQDDKQKNDEIKLSYRYRKFVDIETIVKDTLNWWREIQNLSGLYEEAKIASKYLEKIAPVQIFNRNETIITEGGEYLIHIDEMKKHTQQCVTYISPTDFITWWEKVYSAFDKSRSKKRYKPRYDDALKKADALKAIHFLGNELTDHEVNKLDLTNTRSKTASYMRIYHQKRCPICKKEGLSDKTILRRLNEAHKELNRISNH